MQGADACMAHAVQVSRLEAEAVARTKQHAQDMTAMHSAKAQVWVGFPPLLFSGAVNSCHSITGTGTGEHPQAITVHMQLYFLDLLIQEGICHLPPFMLVQVAADHASSHGSCMSLIAGGSARR